MAASNRSKIDPVLLPPSPRAAFFHGLRVHHQIVVWKDLSEVDKEPLRWGWKIENSNYTPIMTDIEAGPPELLRIVRCGCKGPCGAKCSCRKAGLKCSWTCKECTFMDLRVQMHQYLNLNLMNVTIKGAFLMLLNFNKFMIRQSYLYIGHSYCLIWIYFKLHNYISFI